MNEKVMQALVAGGKIHYAPVSGGLILLMGNEKGPSDVKVDAQPTMQEFLDLRSQNKIEFASRMDQGHQVFRGQVDIYQIA